MIGVLPQPPKGSTSGFKSQTVGFSIEEMPTASGLSQCSCCQPGMFSTVFVIRRDAESTSLSNSQPI